MDIPHQLEKLDNLHMRHQPFITVLLLFCKKYSRRTNKEQVYFAIYSYINIPEQIKTDQTCYILQVKGDSMIEEGIFDGDWVIIEQRSYARNGEIVVALIEKSEATLKFIEQYPHT
jgi:phage repressor protein C with HTH and peptisase S24 domain